MAWKSLLARSSIHYVTGPAPGAHHIGCHTVLSEDLNHGQNYDGASYTLQGSMLYPLSSVEALFTQYICRYENIHSVYEDE